MRRKDKDRFRSKYLDIPNKPLYPFGYGLSYTRFAVSPVDIDRESMTREETLHVSVSVKNVGDATGTETLQLYIRDIAASVVRPVKELKGFQKVTLEPGQEERVSFEIGDEQLRFLTENDRWESESGEFEVYVGTDSSTVNGVKFRLR